MTNIEYTEFKRLGIADEAQCEGSALSVFPANTNVLYLDLKACPLPLPPTPPPRFPACPTPGQQPRPDEWQEGCTDRLLQPSLNFGLQALCIGASS